jgi:hypothetical protein
VTGALNQEITQIAWRRSYHNAVPFVFQASRKARECVRKVKRHSFHWEKPDMSRIQSSTKELARQWIRERQMNRGPLPSAEQIKQVMGWAQPCSPQESCAGLLNNESSQHNR